MGSESRLSNLWLHSRKNIPRKATLENHDKAAIGVLAYEVSSFMSKIANLWHFLRDKDINSFREEIANSIGIQKLVSEDPDYVMDLVLNEIISNFQSLARSVGQLSKKCTDPLFSRFEHFVNDPVGNHGEWLGWDYRLKKMDRKVKELERFVRVTMQLAHENEVLDELEQSLRRMKANPDLGRGKLLEFHRKVEWQRQELRYLREISPWIRTHDYVVRILARSLLTILNRIVVVFEITKLPSPARLPRSRSIHPLENVFCGISSGTPRICDPKSMISKNNPLTEHLKSSGFSDRIYSKLGRSKHGLLEAPCSTLGHNGLALRYGNLIVSIENLSCSPHTIDLEKRDELYNMLPRAIKSGLRTRLKGSDNFSCEAGILDWLSPLAHNTIKWHLERSFERENDVSGSNVLLVQTLHYANQAKIEAAIMDLLVGLTYLCRINGDIGKTRPSKPKKVCENGPNQR